MGTSIAVFNQKGGVGKTTMVVNLSACLAARGKKICVLDIDPQGNATSGFGIDKKTLEATIYDVLVNETDIRSVVIPSGYENLDLIPASVDLAGAEIELTAQKHRERVLRGALQTIKDEYDYIFLDCPPSLGLLTINSLAAVDRILIPIQCEYYALEGVSLLMNTFQMVKDNLNPGLTIQGVVLMMFDGRTNLSIQVVEQVKRVFKGKVYVTIVPRNIRLAEAPSHGQPIIYYDARSKGAEAYLELADEFIDLEEGDW
ncbi:MAG: AAA family ATPase [Bacillota bacterium]|nr:AAA family ATPase [Bacillota bacterium]MDW7677961.1 AAA family ATPase [Bacillota bacterium]